MNAKIAEKKVLQIVMEAHGNNMDSQTGSIGAKISSTCTQAYEELAILNSATLAFFLKWFPKLSEENRDLMIDQYCNRLTAVLSENSALSYENTGVSSASLKLEANCEHFDEEKKVATTETSISVTTEDPVVNLYLLEGIHKVMFERIFATDTETYRAEIINAFVEELRNDLHYLNSDRYRAEHFNPDPFLFGSKSRENNFRFSFEPESVHR